MVAENRDLQLTDASVFNDVRYFPLLTKAKLKSEFDSLRSDQPRQRVYQNTSGGSTGDPARFLQDRQYDLWVDALKILFASWGDHHPGDRHLKIWGAPQDIFGGGSRVKEKIRSAALNLKTLNCYKLSDDILAKFTAVTNRFRPSLIECYADAAFELSKYILQHDLKIHSPKVIITSAGLLRDDMRSCIEDAFGSVVLNRYGSREVGDIACSCSSSPELHVSEATHFIEILDEDGRECVPGQEGDIVVTLLTNYTMPLIRYCIGDRGIWSDDHCECGINTRRLKKVMGRSNDFLLTDSNEKVSGTALTTLLYDVRGINRYQFRQATTKEVTLLIEAAPGFANLESINNLDEALRKLRLLMGPNSKVMVTMVDEIPKTATGKHLYIINEGAHRAA
jgi:phenylacetate-CoA ligase